MPKSGKYENNMICNVILKQVSEKGKHKISMYIARNYYFKPTKAQKTVEQMQEFADLYNLNLYISYDLDEATFVRKVIDQ